MDDFLPLARQAGEPAPVWMRRLVEDLATRHRREVRVPVETYLTRLPGLEAEPEAACDLVVAEWTLRRQAGEAVELAEYLRRFPAWGEELSMLWHVDQRTPLVANEPAPVGTAAAIGTPWLAETVTLPVIFGYRLLREFEGGAMGRVFLAEPMEGGPAVALKVPRLPQGHGLKAVAEHATRLQRFLREASVMRQLVHPGLCRALDVGACDGLPYFTMLYYPNGSVASTLQDRGPFAPRDAARLVADVALALQHAHDLRIVHRDLKPSNLLYDGEGQVVVADFGLAFPLDPEELRLTGIGFTPGTPRYFSPEQACGVREPEPASDIFSLGDILYELLSGQPPFREERALQLLVEIQEASPTPLDELCPDVPPALIAICRRAMAREPADRYRSMAEFADDLGRYLAGTWEPPANTPQPLLPASIDLADPLQGWRSTSRRVGLAVGLVVLLGCLVALWSVLSGSPPQHQVGGKEDPPPAVERRVVSRRLPVGVRGELQSVHDDLGKLEVAERPHMRYFTLTGVHDNPYISDADWGLHLDALNRVVNRLSWNKKDVPLYPVDTTSCVLRIDLRDLGWDAANEWSDLLKAEPYGVRYDSLVHNDDSLRKLARELCALTVSLDSPSVRADWFIVAATRAPLYDHLLRSNGPGRRTPPFDLGGEDEPVSRVVRLYQEYPIDARVAAAELGLGTVAELDTRWPADKSKIHKALHQLVPRSRWAGEEGQPLFSDAVRTLKLGVPRATQPLR